MVSAYGGSYGWVGIRGFDKRERKRGDVFASVDVATAGEELLLGYTKRKRAQEGSDIDFGRVGDRVSNIGKPTGRRLWSERSAISR